MPEDLAPPIPDYELLRPIGRGSYGEVWLARNALGSLRAIKVVWRRNFDDDRPYEREFHGIRRFEPVSRKHECLIDIHHVGRNDTAGCFYYVMELADDAARQTSSDGDYRPLTLREALRASRRLPPAQAIEIGARLASALDHLHRAGLVHRDIKPSNIIFADGVPKLADIGLVTSISDARSFVGTEGFVPPEGPGTPSADIFSLGKVLYELSTGQDRNEFPRLPACDDGPPVGGREFAELNEVILKACDPDRDRRYSSARAMLADLTLLQRGRSLRRARQIQRQASFLLRAGLAAGLLATVASAAYFGSYKPLQRAAEAERRMVAKTDAQRIQLAEERFARDDHAGALAQLARLVRETPGQRVPGERLISALTWRHHLLPDAPPIRLPGTDVLTAWSPDAMTLAMAGAHGPLQRLDLRHSAPQPTPPEPLPEGRTVAMTWRDGQPLLALASLTNLVLHRPASPGPPPDPFVHPSPIRSARFSPNARWLLTWDEHRIVRVWNLYDPPPHTPILTSVAPVQSAEFSPDVRHLVAICDHPGGSTVLCWPLDSPEPQPNVITFTNRVTVAAVSPGRPALFTAFDDGGAALHRFSVSRLVYVETVRFQPPRPVTAARFSPDGGTFATVADDGSVTLRDLDNGSAIGPPLRHRGQIRALAFSPDGTLLATGSDDQTVRLWNPITGQPDSDPMLVNSPVDQVEFIGGGERIAVEAVRADGRWLWSAITASRGARPEIVPGADRRAFAGFIDGQEPDRLAIAAGQSLDLFDASRHASPLRRIDLGIPVTACAPARNGNTVAVASGRHAWIWDTKQAQSLAGPLSHPERIVSIALSPDGQRLAVATRTGSPVLWSVPAGPHQIPVPLPGVEAQTATHPAAAGAGGVRVQFSPDGQFLLVIAAEGATQLHAIEAPPHAPPRPQAIAAGQVVTSARFSVDGQLLAVATANRQARVWNPATGQPMGPALTFEKDVLAIALSPDGRYLATACRDGLAQVWDPITGQAIAVPLRHTEPVQALAFSPDQLRLATGAMDGTVRLWDIESGAPLSEALRAGGPIESIEFSRDGSRLLIVPASGPIQLAPVLTAETPVPDWLPMLAEAIARQRLNDQGMSEPLSHDLLPSLQSQLATLPAHEPNRAWASWFVSPPGQRPIAPDGAVDPAAEIQSLFSVGTPDALRHIVRRQPHLPTAHAQLANLLAKQRSIRPREHREAQWHRIRAKQLAPHDPELNTLWEETGEWLQATEFK